MTAPAVLSVASTLTCADAGTIGAGSTSRLRVAGSAVLLAPLKDKTISGCPVPDDPNTSTFKCRKVSSVSAGDSARLSVGGTSVLLDVLAGLSDGAPPPPGKPLLPAVANQTRLRASAAVA